MSRIHLSHDLNNAEQPVYMLRPVFSSHNRDAQLNFYGGDRTSPIQNIRELLIPHLHDEELMLWKSVGPFSKTILAKST